MVRVPLVVLLRGAAASCVTAPASAVKAGLWETHSTSEPPATKYLFIPHELFGISALILHFSATPIYF